jgi:hypothetical protein
MSDVGLVHVPEDEVRNVRAEVAPVIAAAKALVVQDEGSYKAALEIGQNCADRARKVEDTFKPAREATHKAWKSVTSLIASFVEPLNEAKDLCADKAKVWRRQEESRRQELARKEQAEAQKKADEELLRHATRLEEAGQAQLAQEVIEQPVAQVTVPVQKIEAPAGTSYRSNWQMEVTDFMALVKAVAEGKVDPDVLEPNATVLRQRAKALKSTMKYPGVRVWDEGTIAFRGK